MEGNHNRKLVTPWVITSILSIYLVAPYVMRIPYYVRLQWNPAETYTKLTGIGWIGFYLVVLVLSIVRIVSVANRQRILASLSCITVATVVLLLLIKFDVVRYAPVIIDSSAYDKHSYLQY